jgi:hypothetical protein
VPYSIHDHFCAAAAAAAAGTMTASASWIRPSPDTPQRSRSSRTTLPASRTGCCTPAEG